MSLDVVIETGKFTGDDISESVVIGWEPALVWIASEHTGTSGAWSLKTSDMPGDDYMQRSTAAVFDTANGITITSVGFDVGSDVFINRNATDMHWVAIRKGPSIDTGQYTGDASDPKTIATGRQPALVLISAVTGTTRQWWKLASQPTDEAVQMETAITVASAIDILSTGFDASGDANLSGIVYDWIALYDAIGATRHVESDSYTGDGEASQSVSLGRKPKFVVIYNDTSDALLAIKTDTMPDAEYGKLDTGWTYDTSSGLTLVTDGFDVAIDLNVDGDVYRFIAGYV